MIHQFNPPLDVVTPAGNGKAILIDTRGALRNGVVQSIWLVALNPTNAGIAYPPSYFWHQDIRVVTDHGGLPDIHGHQFQAPSMVQGTVAGHLPDRATDGNQRRQSGDKDDRDWVDRQIKAQLRGVRKSVNAKSNKSHVPAWARKW